MSTLLVFKIEPSLDSLPFADFSCQRFHAVNRINFAVAFVQSE